MKYPLFPKTLSEPAIGIFAPSAGVGHKLESFDRSLDAIRNKGYSIVETPSVRNEGIRSTDAESRGRELNELVKKESLALLISATGGEFCLEMLEHVDFDAIRRNPVWLAGASDPTSILFHVTTALDIATIYGFNAGSFDGEPLHLFQRNALSVIDGDIPLQHSFDMYDGCRDYSRKEFVTDEEVFWYSSRESIDARGRIIGGCLDVLSNIIGTAFDSSRDFTERYRDDGIIWYFDPFDMSPEIMYLTMLRFKHSGLWENTRLVMIGRVMFNGGRPDDDYIELLHRIFDELSIPFIFGADIGHVKPCMTIINGSLAHVSAGAGIGCISQQLK